MCVFNEDYKLASLDEVEDYIRVNRHLSGVPTAEEVEKNGVFLGEINAILLQKIEELTLYTIDQEKRLAAQADEIQALKDIVSELAELNH